MIKVVLTSIFVYIISQILSQGFDCVLVKKRVYTFYNILIVFNVYSFFNMLIWNYELNFLITITFFYILSIAMYYIHEFRGTNLNFSDIASAGTAREVASSYKYEIRKEFVIVFILLLILYFYNIWIVGIDIFKNYNGELNGVKSANISAYKFFWHEIGQVFLFFISFFAIRDFIDANKYDYSLFAGENEGYIYNFFSSIPIFHRNKIDAKKSFIVVSEFLQSVYGTINSRNSNKNELYVNSVMSKYKDYAITKPDIPHVIVIMNESFGSVHSRVKSNIKVTPYYDNLTGVIKGNLYVNTFGGGTANTEFEFLTGMTVGSSEYPVMPYNTFVKSKKYSLARYFKNFGYRTIAMHPHVGSNYNRNKVYKNFGFDDLFFIDSFENKKCIRKFVSDESMYREVISRFNKNREGKAFIFGITMQNHSGYDKFDGMQVLSYLTEHRNREQLDSYLSLMKYSDDALKKFINYFDNVDERVVILFFGDHNASFGTELNSLLYEKEFTYECTNAYATPFFIYDNKNKMDKYVDGISANFLSVELLKAVGLPFDNIHNILKETYAKYDIYNFHKARIRDTKDIVDIENNKYIMLMKEYLK